MAYLKNYSEKVLLTTTTYAKMTLNSFLKITNINKEKALDL